MAKEFFISKGFHNKTLIMIEQANAIIAEMQAQGYTLTVRQLYYQFVSRDLLANKQSNYQKLASVIDDARKAGLIDWNAIEDRTRYLRSITTYDDPADFLSKIVARYYAENLWHDQDVYCEVWIEKDALLGVIERACDEYRVPYFACRSYASSSELYHAGKRLARHRRAGKRVIVFHLGDHDPSGLDMTRVNDESVGMYARRFDVEFKRLALNMNQVEQYNPPPNPAKDTDSRFQGYVDQYGDECWELDALTPAVIDKLLRDNIIAVLDMQKFNAAKDIETDNEATLTDISDNWADISSFIRNLKGDVDETDIE